MPTSLNSLRESYNSLSNWAKQPETLWLLGLLREQMVEDIQEAANKVPQSLADLLSREHLLAGAANLLKAEQLLGAELERLTNEIAEHEDAPKTEHGIPEES